MRLLAAHFWRWHHGFGGVWLLILAVIVVCVVAGLSLPDEKGNDKKP